MDMEINRDIEAQYQKYSGATKTLEGVWYEDYINKHTGKPFDKEIWEVIYDYLIENPDQLPENKQQLQQLYHYSQSDQQYHSYYHHLYR